MKHKYQIPFFILASQSPRRLQILEQMGIRPDFLCPVRCNEEALQGEKPGQMAARLAEKKIIEAKKKIKKNQEIQSLPHSRKIFLLGADTVVARGREILPKPETEGEARKYLEKLSGRNHRVYTAIHIYSSEERESKRLVESRIRFKPLSSEEIEAYLKSKEWQDKAGGYAIQGLAGSFVIRLVGSYSAIMGLPLYETYLVLTGLGWPVCKSWWKDKNAGNG